MKGIEEGSGELVVSGGDGAVDLEMADHALIVPLLAPILVTLAVSIGFPQALAQGSSLPPQQIEAPDTHRVLVIPVNLRGRAPLVVDRKQIMQALYGVEDSVASRYRAVSYGQVEF